MISRAVVPTGFRERKGDAFFLGLVTVVQKSFEGLPLSLTLSNWKLQVCLSAQREELVISPSWTAQAPAVTYIPPATCGKWLIHNFSNRLIKAWHDLKDLKRGCWLCLCTNPCTGSSLTSVYLPCFMFIIFQGELSYRKRFRTVDQVTISTGDFLVEKTASSVLKSNTPETKGAQQKP